MSRYPDCPRDSGQQNLSETAILSYIIYTKKNTKNANFRRNWNFS